jgi:hypothetical protein
MSNSMPFRPTSIASNPENLLAKVTSSLRHSSGVVVPQVFKINLLLDTNMELSLKM